MEPDKPANIEEIVLEIVRICGAKARNPNSPPLGIDLDTELIESGVLDSIAVVEMMIALTDRFGLAARPLRDRFQQNKSSLNTPRRVAELIQNLEDGT
mgnify:CR=1 FL=1